jgi:hypothetical protein
MLFIHIRDLLLCLFGVIIDLFFFVRPIVLIRVLYMGLPVARIFPVAHLRVMGIVMLHFGRIVLSPGRIVWGWLLIFLICHMVLFKQIKKYCLQFNRLKNDAIRKALPRQWSDGEGADGEILPQKG